MVARAARAGTRNEKRPREQQVQRARLHVLGASGSGTTTLAHALASAWSVPHADTDDYFWIPTTPAYTTKRPVAERLALMEALFLPREAWVLSGTLMGWGDCLIPHFDAKVYLTVEPSLRLARLHAREQARYAGRAISADELAGYQEFMEWAEGYDNPSVDGRSRRRHVEWIEDVPCPVLNLDGAQPVDNLVSAVTQWSPVSPR